LSLDAVIGIPLMILFTVASSIASRQLRLLILFPFQMTVMSVVLPLIIISRNEKMKKQIFEDNFLNISYQDFLAVIISTCKKIQSRRVSPLAQPILVQSN
jgi:hypothetical protein